MDGISVKAHAKINLGLDITGKREDGYHLLETVMQTIGLHDDVCIQKTGSGIYVSTDDPLIEDDESNLAYRAAALMKEYCGIDEGVKISIKKSIPAGGGMAGGSTDAAAVITAMNILFNAGLKETEMDEIALKLGADVPFCLKRGTYLAEGIGEKLTRLSDLKGFHVVTCTPHFAISTPKAYRDFDESQTQFHPDVDALVKAINAADADLITANMGNSFEPVAEREFPEISTIKEVMYRAGAAHAMMTGSGSTVFGLFEDREKANECGSLTEMSDRGKVYVTELISDTKGENYG